MSQSNTDPPSLQNERITDLQQFAKLKITKEKLELFEYWESVRNKPERIKEAKLLFRISIGLLIIGLIGFFIALTLTAIYNNTWNYVVTSIAGLMESIFAWGFKHIVQHYYPVFKEKNSSSEKEKTKSDKD